MVLTLSLSTLTLAPVITDQRLADAVAEVTLFGFKNAYPLFDSVMAESTPGSEQWQQAVFGTAVCAHQISPPSKSLINRAEELYKLLIEKTPDSAFAPRAMMHLGRIAELRDYHKDESDLELARQWYSKVLERWPERPIASEATLRIASTYIQTYEQEQVEKGIAILEKWLAAHPDDYLASAMWQYLGACYFFPLKQYRQSLDCYEKADTIGLIEKGREGPFYWRMAVMADRYLNDRDRAIKYYTLIIKKVPTSGKCYESQLALKRLGAPVPKIEIYKKSAPAPSGDKTPTKQQQVAK